MTDTKLIRVSPEHKAVLDSMTIRKDESYDGIIGRLIDAYKRSPDKMNEALVDQWGKASITRTLAGQKILWRPEKQ